MVKASEKVKKFFEVPANNLAGASILIENVKILERHIDLSNAEVKINAANELELNIKDIIYITINIHYGSYVSFLQRKIFSAERLIFNNPPLRLKIHVNKLNEKIAKL